MSRVSLDLRVVDENGAEIAAASLDDLPGDVWQQYAKNAQEMMPERGPKAWAAMVVSHVRNIARRGKRAFILSDIDEAAADAVGELFARMNISFTGAMARLFASGETGKLHIINFTRRDKDDRGPGEMHFLIVTGFEDAWWADLDKAAQKTPSVVYPGERMRGEELLSELLMHVGEVEVKDKK